MSDPIDHMITQNRAEYENLLIKASMPQTCLLPSTAVIDFLIGYV